MSKIITFDSGTADFIRQLQGAGILEQGPVDTKFTDGVDKLIAECDATGMSYEEWSHRMQALTKDCEPCDD